MANEVLYTLLPIFMCVIIALQMSGMRQRIKNLETTVASLQSKATPRA